MALNAYCSGHGPTFLGIHQTMMELCSPMPELRFASEGDVKFAYMMACEMAAEIPAVPKFLGIKFTWPGQQLAVDDDLADYEMSG
jgi:hypothetical protein